MDPLIPLINPIQPILDPSDPTDPNPDRSFLKSRDIDETHISFDLRRCQHQLTVIECRHFG